MRILFIENKQTTWFFELIASKLEENGHQVSWIVQNKYFKPEIGRVHLIPYPSNRELDALSSAERFRRIVQSDRNINYFAGNAHHYLYYEREITLVLDGDQPDVVFGEATLFHELLCIEACRKRKIPYLNPELSRYPQGRSSFYCYDTMQPFAGSDEDVSDETAKDLVVKITQRTTKPGPSHSTLGSSTVVPALRNAVIMTLSRLGGEKYNTPNPMIKIKLELQRRHAIVAWESLARLRRANSKRFCILFPLHQQPEAALDVRGTSFQDQPRLLADMLANCSDDCDILVKPNPSSKYELNSDMIDLVRQEPRLIPVSHHVTMLEVLPLSNLIVTVLGTISIEAVLSGKPVATLIHLPYNEIPSCRFIAQLSDLRGLICEVRSGTYAPADECQKIAFAKWLFRTSYPGEISNAYSAPGAMKEPNISKVHAAFCDVLSKLPTDRANGVFRGSRTIF